MMHYRPIRLGSRNAWLAAASFLLLIPFAASISAQQNGKGGRRGGGRDRTITLPADVAALKSLSVVLGCPTDRSIVANILANEDIEGYIEYGLEAGKYSGKTEKVTLVAGKPVEIIISALKANKEYFYRLRYRKIGGDEFAEGKECCLHTQRAPGSGFTFEIQGDSHPERPQQFDASLYAQTLNAAATDKPDFYVTIGDDFSVDTLATVNADTVGNVYQYQRLFLSLVGNSSPIFLVNGNHEQAAQCNLDGKVDNVAVWAQTSRNRYFSQPAPDSFYTGDEQKVESIGLLRDYYAWTWGDALFIVIDPYWHSAKPVDNVFGGGAKSRDLWNVTLGDAQYMWFKKTLESSKAKYKFVFSHHVLGTGRGGIEQAGLFEWGGKDKRGESQFAANRPGWELPIHQLMAKNGVTIFFQGHDHIFAKQQLDGVVYQTLPEPADPNYALYNDDAFTTGNKLPNSGRVRVSVAPENVSVEYVRSYLPKDETDKQKNGSVDYRYSVSKSGRTTSNQESGPPRGPDAGKQISTFKTDVLAHPFDIILGRPTDKSVTLSVLAYKKLEGYIAYGTSKGKYTKETAKETFAGGEPVELSVGNLKPNTRYYYQFRSRELSSGDFGGGPECTFMTQRPSGSEFTFTLAADSHLDERTNPDLYRQTFANALGDAPDFHIDLGDTFMTDKHANRESAARQYLAQRYYLGLLGHSSPIFYVLGNHDGETARELDGTAGSLGVWSNTMRKRYFPNPTPDSFYTGSGTKQEFAGLLQDYYAWTWGGALFIVLDPYWFTPKMRGEDDNWKRTLGSEQYQWLKRTLESSKAKYKFVFIHNLVGGLGKDARGGVEAASLYEWGGDNLDGTDVFKDKRPGWPSSIHKLLVDNHVSAVFHGHDHIFAKQELDGLIYQEVPQPGFDGRDAPDKATESGYKNGEIIGGAGYMRVRVSAKSARVEYVRASVPSMEADRVKNGTVACSYSIAPLSSSKYRLKLLCF